MAKYKIMFVCLGNICRSPMAEFICKDLVKKAGREAEFEIASSAVSSENVYNGVGAPVYKPAQAELKKHGITCEGKRAQVLKETDGEKYDLFLCMDDSNVRRAKRILGGKNEEKCKKLLSYAGEIGDVADPWYTGDFTVAYADILRGVKGLLDSLE
ncbi:MAG: low molecular weight phosphotyrosine protein phosphatase [Clostridiales bacterium]|nr:low molecular weight phosphotyrosine protein phosphatase [Clostridiales bacterium]